MTGRCKGQKTLREYTLLVIEAKKVVKTLTNVVAKK